MRTKTIEWQVAGACNYDCTYCIQSRRYRRGRPEAAQLDQALEFFAALPGEWELKCSGGEAFAHPLFMSQVVPGLMHRTRHRISVLTNFSSSRGELMRFADATRGRLSVFSASLHLEFADLDDFVAKAAWFVQTLDAETSFVVNQVVLPGREETAIDCRDRLAERGIRWFPQLFKTDGGVAEYPDAGALARVLGDEPGPRDANVAPSYRGRECWTGVDYFAVDKDGSAWACRTAKRFDQGYLGNVYDGTVELRAEPAPCPYGICPCSVPANRGMIEGVGAGGVTAPLYPIEGVVSWNMNTTCNYRCSYCTQAFVESRAQWARDLPRFVEAFVALPGDWEVKLSGGEPFQHPGFEEGVAALAAGGLRVSVVTNLSGGRDRLERFAEVTRDRPGLISASLHLEYADPAEFAETTAWLSARHSGAVCVTCVATRENLPQLAGLGKLFAASGVPFKVQPEKRDRDVLDYSPAELRQIQDLGGHNGTGLVAPNFRGRHCYAGARYFIVDHRGNAYRCYPARRYRQEALGNLLDGSFRLRGDALPCNYDYCNCTVPQQRGMVALEPTEDPSWYSLET